MIERIIATIGIVSLAWVVPSEGTVTVQSVSCPMLAIGANWTNVLVFSGTITSGSPSDTLQAMTVNNGSGTANSNDIAKVTLWIESGTTSGFQATEDTNSGDFVGSGTTAWYWTGSISMPDAGLRFYITVDISSNPTDDRIIKMQVPAFRDNNLNGFFDVGDDGVFAAQDVYDGPVLPVINSQNQQIHSLRTTDIQDMTATNSYGAGWINNPVFNFHIPDNDGSLDTLQALTLKMDVRSTLSQADLVPGSITLWYDNIGVNSFGPEDTIIGTGTWNSNTDAWEFTNPASIPIDGKWFWITVDIKANPSSVDGAYIWMYIPKLFDSGQIGTFNTNDLGIFVASCHDGPTDGSLTAIATQTIHFRRMGDIANNTQAAEFGAGWKNCVLLRFVLPDNDGLEDELQALTTYLNPDHSTVNIADLEKVSLWMDNGDGVFGSDTDTYLGYSLSSNPWIFSPLSNAKINGTKTFFVTADIASTSTNGASILMQIHQFVDTGVTKGSFDGGPERGIFVKSAHDGPVDGTVTTNQAKAQVIRARVAADMPATLTTCLNFGPGWKNCLLLDFTVPSYSPSSSDYLNNLTCKLAGTSDISPSDLSVVKLWADTLAPPGFTTNDSNIGTATWDASTSQWIFSGLSYEIPSSVGKQRFFITGDIALNPSGDNKKVRMKIPKLFERGTGTYGSYDPGEEGLFVSSAYDGPVDADVTSPSTQVIHERETTNLNDDTVQGEFGASQKNCLLFNFVIPDNDTATDTLQGLTVRLNSASTGTNSDLFVVRLFADVNKNGIFEPTGADASGSFSGTLVGNDWWFYPINYVIGVGGQRFFLAADIAQVPSGNGRTIKMEIPQLLDNNRDGNYNSLDKGIFVSSCHEGPTDSNFTCGASHILRTRNANEIGSWTVTGNFGPGWKNQLILDFKIPGPEDTLNAITFQNTTGIPSTNFTSLRLWADTNAPPGFDLGDTNIATATTQVGSSWVFSGLSHLMPASGRRFFLTADISFEPSGDDLSIRMKIPQLKDVNGNGSYDSLDEGIFVSSASDGPADMDFIGPSTQTIHRKSMSDLSDNTINANYGPGERDCLISDLTINNGHNDGATDTLSAITFKNIGSCPESDIATRTLWVSNSGSGFNPLTDTRLATITSGWVFSNLSYNIPSTGTRLFVTADISSAPSGDNLYIRLQIPKLSDQGEVGTYNSGDQGIFVSSPHDGPTDGTVTCGGTQTLHRRASTDITDTAIVKKCGPGEPNCLLANFVIPLADGLDDYLNAITLRLDQTVANSVGTTDLVSVALWADNGNNNFDGTPTDTFLGQGLWLDSLIAWTGLNQSLKDVNNSPRHLFIVVKIADNPSGDNKVIQWLIPRLKDLGQVGTYQTGDEGIFVSSKHWGPVDSDFKMSGSSTVHRRIKQDIKDYTVSSIFGPGQKNCVALQFVLPDNDGLSDTLQALTIRNIGTALGSDISAVTLFADNGNGLFDGTPTDTSLGTGVADADGWYFSPISANILGTRTFFVIANIASLPVNGRTIQMAIPGLVNNGATWGGFDLGEEGIFVSSPHLGPTDGTWTAGATHTIRCRETGSITERPIYGNYGAGWKNRVVFQFSLPDNDGNNDVLQAITFFNAGTALNTDIDYLKIWRDSNNNSIFDVAVDKNIGTATWDGISLWVFQNLSGTISSNYGSQTFFVTADINKDFPSSDDARINLCIPQLLDGGNIGVFDTGDKGLFVASNYDGPTDGIFVGGGFSVIHKKILADLSDNTALGNYGPGEANCPCLSFKINDGHNDGATDTLRAISFCNLGTALSSDFSTMTLWLSNDNSFNPATDTPLASLNSAVNGNWVFSSLSAEIPSTGTYLFVTVSLVNNPSTDNATIALAIHKILDLGSEGVYDSGDLGIFVDSAHNGLVNGTFTTNGTSTIHKRAKADIQDATTSADFYPGKKNALLLNFCLPDNDDSADTLKAITFRLAPTSTALWTDFSEIRLWADTGNNIFDLTDTNLGTATYDGDSWVFSGLSQNIPINGKRFFVTANIVANPSIDDAIVYLEIPKLSDGTNTGVFDAGDEGIFVASKHIGPTDADWTPANPQKLHKRIKADFTDHTISKQTGPGWINVLAFDFKLPDSDGAGDTLRAITAMLASTSTISHTEIISIRLWADEGQAGFQGPGIDTHLATGVWDGDSYEFSGFSQTIPIGGKRLFITADLPLDPSADNLTLQLEIPILYDADSDGLFDTGDEGIFVASCHLGPTDGTFTSKGTTTIHCLKLSDITENNTPAKKINAGDKDVLCLDFTITPGEVNEILKSLCFQNIGSAETNTDIEKLKLWVESGTTTGFSADDKKIGEAQYDGVNNLWYFTGLSQNIISTGTRLYLSSDIASKARAKKTIQLQIPQYFEKDPNGVFDTGDRGIFLNSYENGPTDGSLMCSGIQEIIGKIWVSPTSGWPGDPVTVSGSGFDSSEEIEIDFGTTKRLATATTTNSQFTKQFTVNEQPPNTIIITARGKTSGEIATCTFFVWRAFIGLAKTVDKNGAEAGDILKYTITYTNSGNADATNLKIEDYYPTHTTYETHTDCSSPLFPAYRDNKMIRWYAGTLSQGTSGSVTLGVKLEIPLEYGDFIVNTATAKADQPAAYGTSNEAKTMVTSLPNVTGSITVMPKTSIVYNGWRLLFIVNYRNVGSATAKNVVIHLDEDKENLKDIIAHSGGTYNPASSIIWNVGDIPPGSGGTVTFSGVVIGVPGDTIDITGYISDGGFHINLDLLLNLQAEFSSEWYDWLMFHYGLGHTGYNDGTEDFAPPLEEKWRRLLGGQNDDIRASMAILGTATYVGGLGDLPAGGYFYRINAETGEIIWSYNTGGEIHSSPAIANNGQYVYVGNANGKMYCFSGTETNPGSITPIWIFDTEGGEIYNSPVVWKGLVYFAAKKPGGAGYLYALSGVNGAPCWIMPLDNAAYYSSPAISVNDQAVYIGDEGGVIYCFDAFLGSLTYKYDTGQSEISSSPVVKDGRVYVASEDGYLYCFDTKATQTFTYGTITVGTESVWGVIATGTRANLLWSYNVGSPIKSTPAIADNCLFFGADNGYVYALNLSVVALRWSYKTAGPVISSPAVANGVVYVGSKDGWLYGLDIKGGTETWKYKVGNNALSSPAIARRMLYIASGDGNIYCFERKPVFSLTKQASSSGVNPGGTMTYTLNYSNTGAVGSGVVVIDDLDVNLGTPAVTSFTHGSWTYADKVLRWVIGTVSSMDAGTLAFDVAVNSQAQGTITNKATLKGSETQDIVVYAITPVNDLLFRKQADQTKLAPGGTLTYTLFYSSPYADITNFVIEDIIPGSMTYIEGSAVGGSITYSHNGTWNEFDYSPVSAIKWSIPSLLAGSVGSVSFKVVVGSLVENNTIILNMATASANACSGSFTKLGSATVLVASAPLLHLEKFVSLLSDVTLRKDGTVSSGGTLTYTLVYSNNLNDAEEVVIIDRVPDGLSYLSGSAEGIGTIINYSADGISYFSYETNPVAYIRWGTATLPKNSLGTASFKVRVGDVDDGTLIKNRATITSKEVSTQVLSDEVSVCVQAKPKLTLTKTALSATTPGATLTYTLSYTNAKKKAKGVYIIDRLPATTTATYIEAQGGTSIEYGTNGLNFFQFKTSPVQYIRWNIGELSKGSSGSLSLIIQVASPLNNGTIIENIATITDTDNNIATATVKTEVNSNPVLSINKSVSTTTVSFGDTFTYTLNYKLLCKDTTNIQITDALPNGITLEQPATGDGSITYSSDGVNYYIYDLVPQPITHIRWTISRLSINGTGTAQFITKLTKELDDETVLTNIATITADNAQAKQDKALVKVVARPKLTLTKTALSATTPG
ncbi:MAG: PQQ-binding-like beta-propeller repeat protein, partial [bacterium]|nr:PQQ-binding-like beta-propeller repeat protein [bacterium]